MIVYVAGPMTGYPDFNYPAFEAAREQLESLGYEVLSPTDTKEPPGTEYQGAPWSWYLRRALEMVALADGIALLPGWENSKGAQLERYVGQQLGMGIMPLEEWI